MKIGLLLPLLSLTFFTSFAQLNSYSAISRGTSIGFETDYHCLGVNSSALGWGSGYQFKNTFGSTEFYGWFQSDSLAKDKFKNAYQLLRSQYDTKEYDPQTTENLMRNAETYAKAGVSAQVNTSLLNYSFQGKIFGGIAFSISENYAMRGQLNTESAELLFTNKWYDYFDSATVVINQDTNRVAFREGMSEDTLAALVSLHLKDPLNFGALTNGSYFKMGWNRYYSVGYGRKLLGLDSLFILYGGIGGRVIQSIARIDYVSQNEGASLQTSLPHSAYSTDLASLQISPLNWKSVGGYFSDPVGFGYGLDFSASALLFRKIRVAMAVNNVGRVKYRQKVYKEKEIVPQEISIDGFDPDKVQEKVQTLIRGGQIMEYVGEETFAVNNAGTFQVGGSFQPIKQIQIGIEFIAPFNKENPFALQSSIYSLGMEVRPIRWLSVMTGYWAGGAYQGQIPVGITLRKGNGAYEFGIGSRDFLRFIKNQSTMISMAFCFARVRF